MAILQPAILSLQQTMDFLRIEKWKASKEARAATAQNLASIRSDVEGKLPGLVTAADAAPSSVAAILPLTRNVDALYDVVLRVTVIAESAAPGEQAEALAKSLQGLESARRTLADRAQQFASADQANLVSVQKRLAARPAVAPLCPSVPPPPTARKSSPTRHKKSTSKPHESAKAN
jgi:hypothetical protein